MLLRQPRHGVQRFSPKLVGCDRPQFLLRQLQGQIQLAGVAGVHDGAVGRSVRRDGVIAHQQPGDFLDRPLRGRQPDADYRLLGQGAEALHRQRQVRAALVVGHGVNFVQDQGVDAPQPAPPAGRGEQDVQRFGGGDEDMRRMFRHFLPRRRAGVAGADANADFRPGGGAFGCAGRGGFSEPSHSLAFRRISAAGGIGSRIYPAMAVYADIIRAGIIRSHIIQ